MERVLRVNKRLRFFSYVISNNSQRRLFTRRFQVFHDEYLPMVKQPLPVRARVAFISALRTIESLALSPLEPMVLSTIFELAATPERRRIAFREYY
ncbi:hypothetical protein PINS_up009056 [Pythium insidiosum]|nr:hypothetical protein PINS_up009056 [Pythium insidiosum]